LFPPPPTTRLERPANLDVWRALLARVRAADPAVASVFERGVAIEVSAQRVLVGFVAQSFEGAQASQPAAMDLLQREARAQFGAEETKVALDLTARPGGVTVAMIDEEERLVRLAEARAAVESHALVQKAIALFSAELKDVRLPGGED
jgi:hypothetical protein